MTTFYIRYLLPSVSIELNEPNRNVYISQKLQDILLL